MEYLYGGVPPVAVTAMLPFAPPQVVPSLVTDKTMPEYLFEKESIPFPRTQLCRRLSDMASISTGFGVNQPLYGRALFTRCSNNFDVAKGHMTVGREPT